MSVKENASPLKILREATLAGRLLIGYYTLCIIVPTCMAVPFLILYILVSCPACIALIAIWLLQIEFWHPFPTPDTPCGLSGNSIKNFCKQSFIGSFCWLKHGPFHRFPGGFCLILVFGFSHRLTLDIWFCLGFQMPEFFYDIIINSQIILF